MKVKNYTDEAFIELRKSLEKNIDGSNALPVFLRMINEVDEKFPGIKNIFIHDMGSFMTHWFDMVRDSNHCSKPLRAKILTIDFIMKYSDFNKFTVFCYDNIDDAINPYTNRLYTTDLLSYLSCIVKAIIQTTRRNLGFDTNSKKYGVANNK